MSDQTVDVLALLLVKGLGERNVKQLISYCGSAQEVFSASKKKLSAIPGIGPTLIDTLLHQSTHKEARKIIQVAEEKGMKVSSYLDKGYPSRLKSVIDAPLILYSRGRGNLNPARTLAIVGTRKATAYGRAVTDKIVEACKDLDVQIISGLAYGIDIQSHRAALKNDLSTVGVLAGGLDWIYPSVHKKYAEEMQQTGVIVSECRPGTQPDPHLFPARNRIIAGMADAVIVVEAAIKGGALITARIADSYHRPLFAVPGNIDHGYSEGTNHLIASQLALIYTGIHDLKYHLNWDSVSDLSPKEAPVLEGEEQRLYSLLSGNGASIQIDELAMKSQIPINQVASLLLNLEFKGIVKSMPGKKYGIA